jgi:hypothetical protein
MANDELGDRVVYAPRGRQAEDDLAGCILRAAHIFFMDGQLVWITDGRRVPVFRDVVIELCRRFIVTEHPVERDGKWTVERRPFTPTELTVRNLIRESLPKRVTVVQAEAPQRVEEPQTPQAMTPETEIEIAAGQRSLARHAGVQLPEEIAAGARAASRYAGK